MKPATKRVPVTYRRPKVTYLGTVAEAFATDCMMQISPASGSCANE